MVAIGGIEFSDKAGVFDKFSMIDEQDFLTVIEVNKKGGHGFWVIEFAIIKEPLVRFVVSGHAGSDPIAELVVVIDIKYVMSQGEERMGECGDMKRAVEELDAEIDHGK